MSAQHELTGYLINRYAQTLVPRLAELAGIELPAYDQIRAGPNSHQVKDGKHPLTTDATVHLLRDGDDAPVWFLQFEMQRDYTLGKLATLRAYHGSEVRNSLCGGHTVVLSPSSAVARHFHEGEEQYSSTFAYRTAQLPAENLASLKLPDRSIEEHALAANMTEFKTESPAFALEVLGEVRDYDETAADLLGRAIIDQAADRLREEPALLSARTIEALESLPFYQERKAQWAAEARAEADAAKARAEADAAKARAEADAAKARAEMATMKLAEIRRTDLISCFVAKGDWPARAALARIHSSADLDELAEWHDRAVRGESSAEIFGAR